VILPLVLYFSGALQRTVMNLNTNSGWTKCSAKDGFKLQPCTLLQQIPKAVQKFALLGLPGRVVDVDKCLEGVTCQTRTISCTGYA
jgi:hypothetical protein